MVRQSVRDIFDLLPRNEASQLTKETFVEFVLDLLNLFFPVNSAASNLAIAEEEWVYRGTNEMMSFDTFYERFFTFPFIFLRDIDNVSRNEYIEVWSLIRICLLENAETIWYSALEYSPETTAQRLGQLGCKDANAAGKGEHDPQDVVAKGYRGGGVRGDNNKGQGQHIVKAMKSFPSQRQVDFLPLLCGVGGVSKGDIYRLGGMNFHNSDNYKLFNAKRIVAEDYAEALSVLPASQRVAVVHKRGEWLLKKLERGGAQQYSRDEEEHESNIAGSVVSSDATVSSTKTVSYSSAGTQREDMKQRHANVDAFDRQQELNRLLKSSLWYRRCCERNHQSVVGTDVLIIRSHTSWDMYQHDTYAIPREKPSDVDNLIAFVQNLPDEFFDEVDSLRMRESIYRSGLDARMGRIADASQPLWAKDGTTPELKTLSLQRAASGSNAHSSDTQSSFIQPTTNNSPRAFSENGMSDPSEVCNSHFVSYLTATLEQQYKVRQEPPKPIIAGHKTAQRERLIKEEEERKERRKETRRMNVRQRLRDRLETEFVRYIESNSKRANLLLAVDRMRGKKA
ncbi:hypothetical protein ERJ75_001660600 [Trypanosoma vivax]|nr:hypothetical protein ERJ75_001660600 [Trypanosoma vivax]